MSAIDAKSIVVNVVAMDGFSGPMNRMGNASLTMGAKTQAGMTKAATGMQKFGAVASKVGMVSAIGIAVGLALSAKAAIDFESSFAGVRKTVDASEGGFRRLADGVREMALEIPIGVNELNRIMELGGQLGVEESGLLKFTDTIAKIGVTTTLSTEQASLGFARLDNIMQTGGQEFDRMGATIVDLGNNFAATEDEILTFATRIAPMGATIGMATDQVFAIATAFTSVGIPAERGGTAVQKSLIKMSDAAADGGPKLAAFAKVAGMTEEAFAKMFKRDPSKAFSMFVTGLGKMTEAGENTVPVFNAVELSNQRVVQSLLAMANADEVLTDALRMGGQAWKDNIALVEEAEKRFGTTASKIALAKNNINDLAISIGGELLPVVGDLAKGFSEIIDWIGNLSPAVKSMGAAIAGALGGVALIATGHPIIAGLVAVAGLVALIGHRANEAKVRVESLKRVLERGSATKIDLEQIFGGETIEKWMGFGFSADDIRRALTGPKEEFEKFSEEITAYYNLIYGDRPAGLSQTRKAAPAYSEGDIATMEAGRNQLVGIVEGERELSVLRNRAKQLGITNLPGMQQEIAATKKARESVQLLYHARQGLVDQEDPTIVPIDVDSEYLGDITDAIDDYSNNLADAFSAVEDRVWGHLDFWYEFPEEFDAAFGAAITSMDRQIDAYVSFEKDLDRLDLSPAVETLLRQLVPSPAHMEAWLQGTEEWKQEVIDTLAEQGGEVREEILRQFALEKGDIQFESGEQLLTDIATISQKIIDDSDGMLNPLEVWYGVLDATIAEAEREGKGKEVVDMLAAALGDEDGVLRHSSDEVKAIIDDLIAKLNELQGDYDVNVNATFSGGPYGAPLSTPTSAGSGFGISRRDAFGGNILGGTPTLTGEYGPELFVPFTHGTILSSDKLKALTGSSGETNYELNVYGSTRPDADAKTVLLAANLIGGM